MIGQQGSLGVSPAELLAAKNMASGKSDMNKEISLGGDLTRLMLAAMQLKKTQAELEKLKLTQGASPQTTVAQDVQQGIAQLQGQAPQPQGQPQGQSQGQPQGQPQQMAQMDSGIGGLPAGAMDDEDAFAGGGIVAFAEGDQVESKPPTIKPDREAFNYFVSQGWTPAAAAGFVSNIQAESAFNPNSQHDFDKKTNTYIGTGLVGWNRGRRDQLEAMYGSKPTYQQQLEYLHKELSGETKDEPGTAGVGKRLRDNPNISASDAAAMLSREGIRPKDREGQAKYRGTLAEQLLTGFTGSGNANAAEVPKAAPPPTGIKATLTPSELQAKSDNAALRGVGSSIADIAGTGVAALKDNITSGPRFVARGINAFTGRNTIPMDTSTMTPYLDADRAKNTKPDVTNFADLKGGKLSPITGVESGSSSTAPKLGADAAPVSDVAKPEVASKPKLFSDDNFLTDEIKSIVDAHKNRVPVTREDRLKQFKADRDEFGLKDEFGKEQVDRLASLAQQAKQDRNVGLWMSAATGFFAMGAGKSQYALQNFAAGAGLGVEQANSALNAYSKRQTELNQSQLEIEKARRAEKRGDLESYRAFTQRAEEKEQAADDRYLTRLTSLFGIKQRGQEIKENRLNREESQKQRLDLQRRQLQLAAEKEFRDNMADYAKTSAGILDAMEAKTTGPAAVAAQARIAAKEKELKEGAYASTYSAAGLSNPSAGGGRKSKLDIDAERIMAGG